VNCKKQDKKNKMKKRKPPLSKRRLRPNLQPRKRKTMQKKGRLPVEANQYPRPRRLDPQVGEVENEI